LAEIKRKDVLEIGVGLGSDHHLLATGGNRMTALDLSREHLRLTNKHLRHEGFGSRLVHGDMENMPFSDESFDVIYSFGVLHHTDSMEQAAREIWRVLRPGGKIIISVYHLWSFYFLAGVFFYQGLLQGGFFLHGWKKTLARIEAGAGTNYVPIVRVLSRNQLRRLFGQAENIHISCHHISNRFLQRAFGPWRCEKILRNLGWYLLLTAYKPTR